MQFASTLRADVFEGAAQLERARGARSTSLLFRSRRALLIISVSHRARTGETPRVRFVTQTLH